MCHRPSGPSDGVKKRPRPSRVGVKSHGRSAITNRSRSHLKGDERSSTARRFRDLVAAFSVDFEELSEQDLVLVRLAASLTLQAEILQADQVAGKPVDSTELIKLAGTSRRTLAAVSARAVSKKPAGQTLQDHIAAKYEDDEADDGED
jgi:hypothetical protein